MYFKASCLVGNIFYYYNSSLFGWAAPFMASTVFPEQSGLWALIYLYAFIPLKHLVRPVGSVLWGALADYWGRRPVLTICLCGMVLTTIGIGCLPTGPYAARFLAFFCLLQGFFAAGEAKGAAIYLLEHTAAEKRSWMSSVYDASGIIGILLASLAASFAGAQYWRYLFFGGAVVGLIGVMWRHDAPEPIDFVPTKCSWKVLWQEWRAFIAIVLVSGFSYANYYLVTIFLNGILPHVSKVDAVTALYLNTHLLWIDVLLLLIFGLIATKVGRFSLMAITILIGSSIAIPIFSLFAGADFWLVALLRLALVTVGVALAAPYHAWKLDIVPVRHRLFIGTFASSVGAKLLGAPMPMIATFLLEKTGWMGIAGAPLALLGMMALVSLVAARRF